MAVEIIVRLVSILFTLPLLSGCVGKSGLLLSAGDVAPTSTAVEASVSDKSVASVAIPTLVPVASDVPDTNVGNSRTLPRPGEKNVDLYTVVVQKVPVDEVLFALALDTELELELVGELDGEVTLNAVKQPLDAILRKLASQVPIRYTITDGAIIIEADVPFIKTYRVDYLNITRTTETRVDLATQVGSIRNSPDGDGRSAGSNGSQMRIENSSENRFWDALGNSISGIVDGYSAGNGSDGESHSQSMFVNREAGLITVRANSRQHAIITDLIDSTVDSARRQVLIEATVVEVTLNDQHESGVDWSLLDNNGSAALEFAQVLAGLPQAQSGGAAPDALLTYRNSGTYGDVTATLRLLQQFGDVQVLSSPKIIAMNNQPAVLKVVDNRVYFTFEVNQQQGENGDIRTQIESNVHSVPVGLVMNVTAFVSEDDEVVLNVRPTISRILNFAEDPSLALAGQTQIKNLIPEIQVREMESMLRVNSGQVAIIGGLMQNRADSRSSGLPGVARIPLLGKLFSRNTNTLEKTELLVFLRPTVIHESDFRHHTEQLRRFMPVATGSLLRPGALSRNGQ